LFNIKLVSWLSPELSANLLPRFEMSWWIEELGTPKFSKTVRTNI